MQSSTDSPNKPASPFSKSYNVIELPKDPVMSHLTDWQVIAVHGIDTWTFLQGQFTCDMTQADHNARIGCCCNPLGETLAIFYYWREGEQALLAMPRHNALRLLPHMKKYSVFSKVKFEDVERPLFGLAITPEQQLPPLAYPLIHNPQRALWLPTEQSPFDNLDDDWEEIITDDGGYWLRQEIEAAIPTVVEPNLIPQNYNLQALDAISFSKGCYTGQETVARAKYRGSNKRQMLIVQSQQPIEILDEQPIELERLVGEHWRSCGHLLRQFQLVNGVVIGLIILPTSLVQDKPTLRCTEWPLLRWDIKDLPYSLD